MPSTLPPSTPQSDPESPQDPNSPEALQADLERAEALVKRLEGQEQTPQTATLLRSAKALLTLRKRALEYGSGEAGASPSPAAPPSLSGSPPAGS